MTTRMRLLGTCAGLLLASVGVSARATEPSLPATAPAVAAPHALEDQIIAVSRRVTPAVVHVEAIVRVNDRRRQVTGSGLVARADGLILTNHHVVDRALKVEVRIPGRKGSLDAEVLGSDAQTDIAVLRVHASEPLATVTFGRATDVRVGQWVLAVGNPYGLDGTVSLGIVSAKGRNLEVPHLINDFIQTYAMIDRGSSGGPLVDLAGRVIGINSRGQGRGIGFTIPVDTVLQVMHEIEHGGVQRGWLGVSVQPLDRDLADYLGLGNTTGVFVTGVSQGSPAARAGLREGDLITAIARQAVEAEKDEDLAIFQRQVAALAPGKKVRVRILRAGHARALTAKIGIQPHVEPVLGESDLGFQVQEITERRYRAERLQTRAGAYVSFVASGSPAAEAGLFRGDVVVRVDELPVKDVAGFRRAMQKVHARNRVLLRARRGSDLMLLLVRRSAPPATPEDTRAADQAADGGKAATDGPAS